MLRTWAYTVPNNVWISSWADILRNKTVLKRLINRCEMTIRTIQNLSEIARSCANIIVLIAKCELFFLLYVICLTYCIFRCKNSIYKRRSKIRQ